MIHTNIFKKIATAVTSLAKPLGLYATQHNRFYATDVDTVIREAYDNPFFYTPINAIAKAFNNASVGVYKKVGTKWLKSEDSAVNSWLEQPSFATTKDLFQEYYITWMLLHGGFLLYKTGITRKFLHIYAPDAFTIALNDKTLDVDSIEINGEIFRGKDLENFKLVKRINVEDRIAGVSTEFRSPIKAVALQGDLVNFAFKHQLNQVANSGKRTGILEFTKLLGKEKQDAITERFNNMGSENAGSIATVQGQDFKFTPLDITPQEMDWLNTVKFAREVIASSFGVPIQLISTEGTTYNNVKEFKKKLYSDVVEPELRAYCQNMTAFLKSDLQPNEKIWYDLSGIEELKLDSLAVVKELAGALDGKITINEFRQLANSMLSAMIDMSFEPISDEMANQILVAANIMALNDVGLAVPEDVSDDETEQGTDEKTQDKNSKDKFNKK